MVLVVQNMDSGTNEFPPGFAVQHTAQLMTSGQTDRTVL